jgi:hypothetical protein
VQISRVVFYAPSGAEISLSDATATNPGGSNPRGEEPQRVLESRSFLDNVVILHLLLSSSPFSFAFYHKKYKSNVLSL